MPIELLWTDGSLVAGGESAESPWLDVRRYGDLRISRAASGGTYGLEVEWSADSGEADVVEAVTVPNNGQVQISTAATHARFRVKNTGSGAFTAHRTNVHGWS